MSFEYGKSLTGSLRDASGNVDVFGSSGIVGKHTSALIQKPCLIVGRKGNVGSVFLSKEPCWPIDTAYFVYPPESVAIDFAFYLLKHLKLAELDKSTAIPGLNRNDAYKQIVSLPPLPEQRRIVAKLEELFSKLDAGVAAVRRAQALLKRYRQSVLHAAVTGELTRAWREAHPTAPTETGAALLQHISAERRAQWQATQVAKRGGQLPMGEGWKSKYAEPEAVEMDGLLELPEGWAWARLNQVSEATGGFAFSSPSFSDSGQYQVIKIANVKPGKLVLDSRPAFINASAVKDDVTSKYLLRKNDCVITLTGTREKRDYGFVCRIREESNLLINQRLAFIRFYSPLFAPFFEYALMSKHFQDNFFKYETGNVGQGNVGMRAITDETIMLPPLAEQAEIVAEVERRLTVLDALSQTLTDELKRAERLRQSILHQAFTGRLVPQDATDEPAAALLARLRETAIQPKTRKTKETPVAPAKEKKPRGRKPADATQIDFSFTSE